MTTDYHAFYLSTASSRIIVFFTHSTSPDVGLTLFRNPSFIGLCIDDTYFPWYTQPLPSAVPPSLAAVLHISVACRSSVVEVGLRSSLSCFGSVDTTKWRLSSTKLDDDEGTPGYWLMHGMGTTPAQDPEQSLRCYISPLLMSVVRVHTSPVSEAHSCIPSFLKPSNSPPSQSHSYSIPSINLLEANDHFIVVPYLAPVADTLVPSSFARFLPRESADQHDMESNY